MRETSAGDDQTALHGCDSHDAPRSGWDVEAPRRRACRRGRTAHCCCRSGSGPGLALGLGLGTAGAAAAARACLPRATASTAAAVVAVEQSVGHLPATRAATGAGG